MSAPRAYLTVTIDCECDKGPRWRVKQPLSFVGVSEGIANRLEPLFARFGAKGTYLLSSEVLSNIPSRDVLRPLFPRADFGTHLHGEFAEPGAFVPEVTAAFQRDYPAELERAKLGSLTTRFREVFGVSPQTFRAGRFGIGRHSIRLLEELGYTVDSSVTPHLDWSVAGAKGLNFRDAPCEPYFPDYEEPGRRGSASILEVPVTIRQRPWNKLPWLGSKLEPLWLRPTKTSLGDLLSLVRAELRENSGTRFLNAMFHNVEITPGTSPYAATESEAQAILDRLAGLLAFAKANHIPVVGLSEIPHLFRSSGA